MPRFASRSDPIPRVLRPPSLPPTRIVSVRQHPQTAERKYPVGIAMVECFPAPCLKSLGEHRVHDNLSHAFLVLALSLFSFRPVPTDLDLAVPPIDIRP